MRLPQSSIARMLLGFAGVALAATLTQELWRGLSYSTEKFRFFTGVRNFGRINDHLYRGAQPSSDGYAALRQLGVDTIVRLSLADEGGAAEEREVTALGMRYVSIPMTSIREPTDNQAIRFLTFMRDNPKSVVFVHCKSGSDRTGVMIALWRLTFDHWSVARAVSEMNAFHYHVSFLPHLQRYVEAFDPVRTVPLPGPTEGSGGKS